MAGQGIYSIPRTFDTCLHHGLRRVYLQQKIMTNKLTGWTSLSLSAYLLPGALKAWKLIVGPIRLE